AADVAKRHAGINFALTARHITDELLRHNNHHRLARRFGWRCAHDSKGPISATAGPPGRAPRRGDCNPDKQHRDLADSTDSPDSESGFAAGFSLCASTRCWPDWFLG